MDFPLFVFFARRNLVGARNGSDKKLKRKKNNGSGEKGERGGWGSRRI